MFSADWLEECLALLLVALAAGLALRRALGPRKESASVVLGSRLARGLASSSARTRRR
jgi:hypothetical protein